MTIVQGLIGIALAIAITVFIVGAYYGLAKRLGLPMERGEDEDPW